MFTHDAEEALRLGAELVNTMPGSIPGDSSPTAWRRSRTSMFFADSPGRGASTTTRQSSRPSASSGRGCAGSGRPMRPTSSRWSMTCSGRLVRSPSWSSTTAWLARPLGAAGGAAAERMAAEFAFAMVDVVRAGGLDRLRVCEGDDCDDVIVDLSKNRSRRYCDGGCAARATPPPTAARKASRA